MTLYSPWAATPQSSSEFNYHSVYFGRTIREAILLAIVNLTLLAILQILHWQVLMPSQSNADQLELIGKLSPLLLIITGVVIAPCLEEVVFRGLPFLMLQGLTRKPEISLRTRHIIFWVLGSLAAVAFAFAHVNFKSGFHLPLPQLLFGLWSWRVIAARGLRYSMLLHGVYNALPLSLILLKQAVSPT